MLPHTTVGTSGAAAAPARAARLGLLLLGAASAGCLRRLYTPPVCTRPDLSGCLVERVDVLGNRAVSDDALKERLATVESAHLFGGALAHVPILSVLDRLTLDPGRLDPFVFERDLARVERYYRGAGYYDAEVRAGRAIRTPGSTVRVEIVVAEGSPARLGVVELTWTPVGSPLPAAFVDAKDAFARGKAFREEDYEAAKKRLARALTDAGYAYATVKGDARVDLVRHEVSVTFSADLGPACTFGELRFEGLGEIPEAKLRASLGIEAGQPFSTAKLDAAQIQLAEFGVLGSIDVVPELGANGAPNNPVVPVVFRVQPAALRAVRLGVGIQAGNLWEAHLLVGWENRNFLGGLRRLSVEAKPGVVVYPWQIGFYTPRPTLLPELGLRFELQQPGFVESRTKGIVRGAFNLYRLVTSTNATPPPTGYILQPRGPGFAIWPNEENVVGYRELATAAGVERPFFSSVLYAGLFYDLQRDTPFSYNESAPPAGFTDLTLSYLEGTASLDFRKGETGKPDKLHPHRGAYLALDAQVTVGGDAADVRLRPEVRAYVPVAREVTLGYRLVTGLLFPRNYGRTQGLGPDPCASLQATPGYASCEGTAQARDLQILQFRAFFSGGASSNRGYPYNGVGPQAIPPPQALQYAAGQLIATGGSTLWESSFELRFPVHGKLGAVLFVDGSDVTRGVAEFRLRAPHLSAGLGLRYDTPVGPLRADLGYRLPSLQVLGVRGDVPVTEGNGGSILGLPIAASIAIGEAF